MEREKSPMRITVMMFIGGILILLNALLFASNGGAIIWSSSAIQPQNLTGAKQPLWWRLGFGYRGLANFTTLMILLVAAVVIVFSAIAFFMKPRYNKMLGISTIICGIISLVSGGGFIIGMILAVGSGLLALEFPKKAEETFFGRIYRAARFDSSVFKSVGDDPTISKQAVLTLMFVNLLSGIGIGLYAYNSSIMVNNPNTLLQRILLFGEMRFDATIFTPPIVFMGIAIIKWVILTGLLYIAALSLGVKTGGEKIGRVVAFAYAPIALQFFIPFVFTSDAYLNLWPSIVFIVTNVWVAIILMVGLKQIMEIGFPKAFGIVTSAGSAYYLINYFMFIKPETAIRISRTISLLIYPEEYMLLGIFAILAFGVLIGAFTKK